MDVFFLILLVAALIAILLKWLIELVLGAVGRHGALPVLEDRIGALIFLVCADVMAAIAYWYPWYVSTRYAAPDDRYGFVLLFGFPFWFLAGGISAWALFRLLRALVRGP